MVDLVDNETDNKHSNHDTSENEVTGFLRVIPFMSYINEEPESLFSYSEDSSLENIQKSLQFYSI